MAVIRGRGFAVANEGRRYPAENYRLLIDMIGVVRAYITLTRETVEVFDSIVPQVERKKSNRQNPLGSESLALRSTIDISDRTNLYG